MKEKILVLKEKVLNFYEEHKEKAIKFYENHKTEVNNALICIACLFLGYTKGKADSLDRLSDINYNFRVVDKDAGEKVSGKSH